MTPKPKRIRITFTPATGYRPASVTIKGVVVTKHGATIALELLDKLKALSDVYKETVDEDEDIETTFEYDGLISGCTMSSY